MTVTTLEGVVEKLSVQNTIQLHVRTEGELIRLDSGIVVGSLLGVLAYEPCLLGRKIFFAEQKRKLHDCGLTGYTRFEHYTHLELLDGPHKGLVYRTPDRDIGPFWK